MIYGLNTALTVNLLSMWYLESRVVVLSMTLMWFPNRIYHMAFPDGVDNYATPSSSPGPSRKPSKTDINRSASLPPLPLPIHTSGATLAPIPTRIGFFGRWNSSSKVPSISSTPTPLEPDGPIEELIIAGAAFGKCLNILRHVGLTILFPGYGLFNLVFSLLPPKIRCFTFICDS